MIKINLSTSTKQLDLSNIGGFDLSRIHFKALLVILPALLLIPDMVLTPMFEDELNTANQSISTKRSELANLKSKVNQSKMLEKQIIELKAQEENLGKKLIAVKQTIGVKKNPATLLLYIAKNIPPELWIKELLIENDTMFIKGEALDYTSIGNFVNSLRSSVFIKDANIAKTNSAVRELDKKRIESFEVRFTIARFDQ
ncbi:MAG TPA: PilN domain-containing protein [Bacteriovoracaceae bacterium]|nr:PilN domain-containing protein [Bacteriovoracaceae bacterium]